MNIAICIIATGNYYDNIKMLKSSIDDHFLKNHKKSIFLFTDSRSTSIDNISYHFIENLPWPLITLLRFRYFLDIKSDLLGFDFVYYIDSDCEIVNDIDDEILPDKIGQLIATEHPWQGCKSEIYETDVRSKACVTDNKNTHYFQGCFFGGYSNDFLKMSEELYENIKCDLRSNIIAKWHDESHLNKYFIEHPPKALHMGYAYPAPNKWNQKFPCEQKIIHYNFKSL